MATRTARSLRQVVRVKGSRPKAGRRTAKRGGAEMGLEANSGSGAVPIPGGTAFEGNLNQPDLPLVREQLERILSSQEFLGSDRARRFLRYVVEETLEGRADRIKAFSVAVAAFDRDESFDPQTDPIVRIEAGRLRRSLERYYLVAGAADPVRIDIPKGGYVPAFSWLGSHITAASGSAAMDDAASSPESPPEPVPRAQGRNAWSLAAMVAVAVTLLFVVVLSVWPAQRPEVPPSDTEAKPSLPEPSVAVLPFSLSGVEQPVNHLSSGMTSELVRELSRYSSLFVLGPQALRRFGAAPDVTVIGNETGVRFVISGGVQHVGQRVRVAVQLSDTDTGGVVWAEAYERAFAVEGIFDLQVEIAQDIVRRIAQPQGAIALFDWKRTRGKAPEAWDSYDCVIQADDLHRRVLPPSLAPEIRDCLQRTIAEEPGYADGWVMSALVAIDGLRFTPLALSSREEIDAAYAAAKRAVELAPDSGRAHLALTLALFFQGHVEEALAAGETAVRLSPHDSDILGEVGLRNILSGDLEAGVALVNRAIKLDQSVSITTRLALAMAALREGRYRDASDAAEGEGQASNFVYWSMMAAFRGKAGQLEQARLAAGELLKLHPDFADWAWVEMHARNLVPEIALAMAEGWRAAGLMVPLSDPDAKE